MPSSAFSALLLLVACCATVRAMTWIACPNVQTKGKATNVNVPGCETTPVCALKKGTNVSMEIDFTIGEDSFNGTSVVHGIIDGAAVPFPLPNPAVCKDSGVQCPLKSGSPYSYRTYIYVNPSYPDIKLEVRWEIQDADANDIICVLMPVEIVDGFSRTPKTRSNPNPLHFNLRTRL